MHQPEEPPGIRSGGLGHGPEGLPPDARHRLRNQPNMLGFVAFAAMRHGGEEGRVGLDQQAVAGDEADRRAQGVGVAEGDDARDREEQAQVEVAPGVVGIAGEAVDHGAGVGRLRAQHRRGVGVRVADVDDQRKAELALQRFFTTENLTALRELALMRVANQVDETLLSRWSKGRIPETRERVLVCVTPRGPGEDLIRRGARVAQRARGDLLVVHVRERDDAETREWLAAIDRLTRDLGGELQVIDADDAVEGVLGFAYRQYVTQLVIGEPLRSRWQELLRGSFVNRVIRKADNIDIHVIARRER